MVSVDCQNVSNEKVIFYLIITVIIDSTKLSVCPRGTRLVTRLVADNIKKLLQRILVF